MNDQKKEVPTASPEELEKVVEFMHQNPGVYMAGDVNDPSLVIPMISMEGKVYAVQLEQQPLDRSRFLPSLTVHGPYVATPPDASLPMMMLKGVQRMLWMLNGSKPEEEDACPHCLAAALLEKQSQSAPSDPQDGERFPCGKKVLH